VETLASVSARDILQSDDSLRWIHRRQFLHGLLTSPSLGNGDDDDEVTAMLRDARLREVAGKTLISGIVGHVTHFLSQCCESESCPLYATM
jgi:hypothetical protein